MNTKNIKITNLSKFLKGTKFVIKILNKKLGYDSSNFSGQWYEVIILIIFSTNWKIKGFMLSKLSCKRIQFCYSVLLP